jgi:ATP-dependent phosphofructokinase / diphosphate-dependent phosphofructokinase
MTIQRIGVLTGGGDAPGLNAVIRAVTKAAIGQHGWEVTGIEDGFDGLVLPNKTRPLTLDSVRGILPLGGTILGTTNRGNPFAYAVTVGDKTEVRDVSDDVIRRCSELALDALVVIGGDGSLSIANELHEKGLSVVGVPKTIDNDIAATDRCFGFQTAVLTATEALDKLHTTAESHHRVMLLEVMGREAGWIALECGLAGGADAILIPEIPFTMDCIYDMIHVREQCGRKFSIVVVAEGAKPLGGKEIYQDAGQAGGRLPRLGGIAVQVGAEIEITTGKETRVTVLGHVQRGGSPIPFDRVLGTRFGAGAVDLIAEGRFGDMVALRGTDIVPVRLADAIGRPKLVSPQGQLVKVATQMGICMGQD